MWTLARVVKKSIVIFFTHTEVILPIFRMFREKPFAIELTGDPKSPPNGSPFWLGFDVPDPYGYRWGHVLFRPLKGPSARKIASEAQNQDFSEPIER